MAEMCVTIKSSLVAHKISSQALASHVPADSAPIMLHSASVPSSATGSTHGSNDSGFQSSHGHAPGNDGSTHCHGKVEMGSGSYDVSVGCAGPVGNFEFGAKGSSSWQFGGGFNF
jgi:hypothetical protein